MDKVKQTQRVRLVNTESPIPLSKRRFNRRDVPQNIHEKEKLMSVSIIIIFIILLLLALEFIIKCTTFSLTYRYIVVSLQSKLTDQT